MDAALRQRVRERANDCCEYCRLPAFVSRQEFHVEHVVARFHGGSDKLENLALACPRCNQRKGTNLGGLDPDTGAATALFHPRRDVWRDHFVTAGARIVGRTPIGRTSVWILDLNTEDRLKIREALVSVQAWP